jgi:anti-sigma28 factor (negative regulator of flagellin synthesis)
MEKSPKGPLWLVVKEGVSPKRIARVRQQIADGTYETPAKIDKTVDRVLQVLEQESPDDSRR